MAKTPTRRVEDSFDSSDHEDVSKYLDWLSNVISNDTLAVRRMATLVVLLIAVFELVNESPKVRLSLGSFQLYKGSIVIQFVPALVAFLSLQTLIDTERLNNSQRIFSAAFGQWSEKAKENDLDNNILPPMPLYWNVGGVTARRSRVANVATYVLAFTLIFGVIAFEAQAYYVLYRLPTGGNIYWLVSVGVTAICIITAFSYTYDMADV
jgi:hypothetical protein